jgi:hypothetical protein
MKSIPWVSACSLLYPIGATISLYSNARTAGEPSALLLGVGFGIASLGYLLAGAALLTGTFRVFGLIGRLRVFTWGVVAYIFGTVLSNLG